MKDSLYFSLISQETFHLRIGKNLREDNTEFILHTMKRLLKLEWIFGGKLCIQAFHCFRHLCSISQTRENLK